jgi:hypothetical protein
MAEVECQSRRQVAARLDAIQKRRVSHDVGLPRAAIDETLALLVVVARVRLEHRSEALARRELVVEPSEPVRETPSVPAVGAHAALRRVRRMPSSASIRAASNGTLYIGNSDGNFYKFTPGGA